MMYQDLLNAKVFAECHNRQFRDAILLKAMVRICIYKKAADTFASPEESKSHAERLIKYCLRDVVMEVCNDETRRQLTTNFAVGAKKRKRQ